MNSVPQPDPSTSARSDGGTDGARVDPLPSGPAPNGDAPSGHAPSGGAPPTDAPFPVPPPDPAAALERAHGGAGIDEWTPTTRWEGDPMDVDLALGWLRRHEPPLEPR